VGALATERAERVGCWCRQGFVPEIVWRCSVQIEEIGEQHELLKSAM
jgi:hypothetical protein